MKFIHFPSIVFLLLAFTSCTGKKYNGVIETFSRRDFKESRSLIGIKRDLVGIFRPLRIKVIPEANLLIVLEGQANDYFASVFTLDSIKFKQRLIKNGYGKGEQLSPMALQYMPSEKRLYVFDHLLQSFFYYSIDSLMRGTDGRANGVIMSTKNQLKSTIYSRMFLNPILLDHHHSVVSVGTNLENDSLHLLDLYDSTFQFRSAKGQYPLLKDTFPSFAYREVFFGSISLPAPDRIVYSYYNTDILSLYDTTGSLLKSIQGPDIYQTDFQLADTRNGKTLVSGKNSRLCYMPSVRLYGESYLTLYSGNLIKKRQENGMELLMFSNKLDPQKIFRLDQKIFDFDVDDANGYIYGLSNINRPHIVIFKM